MTYDVGDKFHVDCLFDDGGVDCRGGMRLVDDVRVITESKKYEKKFLYFRRIYRLVFVYIKNTFEIKSIDISAKIV
jgi:hypothetical protein